MSEQIISGYLDKLIIIYICGYWTVEAAGFLAEKLRDLKDDVQIAIRAEKYHRTGKPPSR